MSTMTLEQALQVMNKVCGYAFNKAYGADVAMKVLKAHLRREVKVPDVLQDVLIELKGAINKFPTWPTDPLHAVGVLNEEVGELAKAVLQEVYEPKKNKPGDVRKEALQAAAMALRFLVSIDSYEWAPGVQHAQENLKFTRLLTETADYDTPGSWGAASTGWPYLHDSEMKFRCYVIAHPEIVPYGGYVTVGDDLRIHPDYFEGLKAALAAAPTSVATDGQGGERK